MLARDICSVNIYIKMFDSKSLAPGYCKQVISSKYILNCPFWLVNGSFLAVKTNFKN